MRDPMPEGFGGSLAGISHLGALGRHWLDTVHFGENGSNTPPATMPGAMALGEQALNADMAYDAFARMQLAGDVFSNLRVIATGFYRAAHTLPSNDGMRQTMRQDEMEDMVALVSQTFLGMTTHCARCHDHV